MELHHAEYRDEIHEFMKVSLVFNLCQGSAKCPDDVRYVGMKCKLPIIRHRLQRLFNRKLIDTILQFDTYRLLDPHIGTPGNTTIQPKEIQRAWDEGFYDPVNRAIPVIILMIADALAISIKQGTARVVLADEKRNDASNNLHTAIPITPHVNRTDVPNTNGRTFGDILVVQTAALPTTKFPTNKDYFISGNTPAREIVNRYSNMSKLWNDALNP